ncbi:MAG: YeeE/YedE family protein [Alphaproteobacteria bacterium]
MTEFGEMIDFLNLDALDYPLRAVIGGLVIGLIFGGAALISGFCLRTLVIGDERAKRIRQIRIWMIAIMVGLIGIYGLTYFYDLSLAGSIYRMDILNPIAILVGGIMFGSGMVLARGCLARHLVLGGTGNIRSWVVLLVAGLSAYATARGIFAYGRIYLGDLWVIEHDSSAVAPYILGVVGLLFVAGLLYARRRLFQSESGQNPAKDAISALLIGGAIVASFYVTAIWALDEFDPSPAESLRFTLPLGDGIVYLLTHTGADANFSIALIGGVGIGSFIIALMTKRFSLQGFEDARSTLRYMFAGVLMGIGGVMALGCTIGQGLVGLSSLSSSAPLAIFAFYVGGKATNAYLQFRDHKVTSLASKSPEFKGYA